MKSLSSRLKVYLNMGTLAELPEWSVWPGLEGREALACIREAGFDGVQDGDPVDCRELGMGCAGSGRVDQPGEAVPLARRLRDQGYECATLHVGRGFESDAEMDAIARAIISATEDTGFPLMVETHRATMTQDPWRTIQLLKRNPGLMINGDFSHYYTGLELVYGDFQAKLDRMAPIFANVRFMHGRIGNPSHIQVGIGDGSEPLEQEHGHAHFVADYREMWKRAMHGFLDHADPDATLVFAPEILAPSIYYARLFRDSDGTLREESDRYQQALVYARIAREVFASLS